MRTLLIFSFLFALNSSANELYEQAKGNWLGSSKNIYSIYGDVFIDNKELVFSIKGTYKYKIIKDMNDSLVLELENSLRCGKFVRLGPFNKFNMEFSVYKNQEDALLPKAKLKYFNEKKYSNYCSWGIYTR